MTTVRFIQTRLDDLFWVQQTPKSLDFNLHGTVTGRMLSKDRATGNAPKSDRTVVLLDSSFPGTLKHLVVTNVIEHVAKTHRHRHNQTLAYHLRIQKKWNKRFKTDPTFSVTQLKQLALPSSVFTQIKDSV